MPPLRRILLLYNTFIEAGVKLADELDAALTTWDCQVTRRSVRDTTEISDQLPAHDLVLTLGGDGSILRAARLAAHHDVPILGINFGKVGFLAELQPTNVIEQLPSILAGNYWLEERVTVRADLVRGGKVIESHDALNEVLLARGAGVRVVRVRTYINDQYVTSYTADGVIVSTATGSTAYALAAGGPILHPEVRTLILKAICPHLTLDRALVLPPTSIVRLELDIPAELDATLSVDGQVDRTVYRDDAVVVRTGPLPCRFVRIRQRDYFYGALLDRLHL